VEAGLYVESGRCEFVVAGARLRESFLFIEAFLSSISTDFETRCLVLDEANRGVVNTSIGNLVLCLSRTTFLGSDSVPRSSLQILGL